MKKEKTGPKNAKEKVEKVLHLRKIEQLRSHFKTKKKLKSCGKEKKNSQEKREKISK